MSETDVVERLRIARAESPADIAAVRALFLEYARSLGFSLCFQGFDRELAALPGAYAPPRGRLLLATLGNEVAGCVGLQPLDGERCEMRRLYLRPDFRRRGVGRRLAETAVAEARAIGYRRIALETLESMHAARSLYASLGFRNDAARETDSASGVIRAELDLAR
jgi:ribosomal protein S18 acetylase RimI-like enzyme